VRTRIFVAACALSAADQLYAEWPGQSDVGDDEVRTQRFRTAGSASVPLGASPTWKICSSSNRPEAFTQDGVIFHQYLCAFCRPLRCRRHHDTR